MTGHRVGALEGAGGVPPPPPGRGMPAAVRMPAVVRMPACHSRRFKGERPIGAATGYQSQPPRPCAKSPPLQRIRLGGGVWGAPPALSEPLVERPVPLRRVCVVEPPPPPPPPAPAHRLQEYVDHPYYLPDIHRRRMQRAASDMAGRQPDAGDAAAPASPIVPERDPPPSRLLW